VISTVGPSRCARASGFSLVEVLIAIAITGFIGAMTVGAFRQVDRAQEIARDQGDRYAAARLALTRLAHETSMAFISDHFDTTRIRERPTLFKGRDTELLFTTMAHVRLARDAKESDQSVVEYTVGADPDHSGEQALFRREKPHIDEDADRGGRRDLVCDHVTAFRIQYWDDKKKDWAREWSTRSVDHTNDLPTRVRFTLEFQLDRNRTEKLTTEAQIALTRPLDF
jgi:general secretion pathway protein J